MTRSTAPALLAGLLTVFAVFALGAPAPAARADGDPASDVLPSQDVFIPFDAHVPVRLQLELGSFLSSADRGGFQVRVAIIARQDDLGSITALWREPAAYARFLGIELSLTYTQRLLVVMPDGFGFYWSGHPAAGADRLLATVPIRSGGTGLADTAETAVRTLAAASGITVGGAAPKAAPTAPGSGSGERAASAAASSVPVALVIAAVVLALAAGAVGIWLARRGRLRPG